MMNPVQVRSFAAVVESGGFTRAAERLDLTQAAVSQHVRQLEARLGPLLMRHHRAITLTPAGEALMDYARTLDLADRELTARLADGEVESGEVSLITPGSVGLRIYPLLLDHQSMNPGLVIRHRFAPDAEVLDAVLENRFELGLMTTRPDDLRLAATAFAEEPLELVAPAGARVAAWGDLEGIGFIDHPDGYAMAARLLTRRFPHASSVRRLPVRGFSNQIGLILEPVARGLGFTVLPRYARQAFPRQDAIQVVEGAQVVDTLWLIHRAEWPLSARAARTIAYLRGTGFSVSMQAMR